MAVAVRELEETLASAKAQVVSAVHGASSLSAPKRVGVVVAAGVAALLLSVALVIIALASEDTADSQLGKRLLLAPEDDEDLSVEESAQLARSKMELEHGKGVPWESVRDELKTV